MANRSGFTTRATAVARSDWPAFFGRGPLRRLRTQPRGVILCDGAQGETYNSWKVVSDATISLDQTNVSICSRSSLSAPTDMTSCLKIVPNHSTNPAIVTYDLNPGGNWGANPHLVVDFYFPTDDDAENTLSISVKFATWNGGSTHSTFIVWAKSSQAELNKKGYYRWSGTPAMGNTTSGVFLGTAIDYVQVSVAHVTDETPEVLLMRVMGVAPIGTAAANNIYIPTFDDINISDWRSCAYLASWGIPATLFTPTSYPENAVNNNTDNTGRLSWEQLRVLRWAGHCVGCHGHDHGAWDTMTEAERERDVMTMQRTLRQQGFAEGAGIFRPPYDRWAYQYAAPYPRGYDDTLMGYLDHLARTTKTGANGTDYQQLLTTADTWGGVSYASIYDNPTKASAMHTANKADKAVLITAWHKALAAGGDPDDSTFTWGDFVTHVNAVGADVLAGTTDAMTVAELR